eukprot:scaffold27136_cov118-Isochrysis_galbana.AAC.2
MLGCGPNGGGRAGVTLRAFRSRFSGAGSALSGFDALVRKARPLKDGLFDRIGGGDGGDGGRKMAGRLVQRSA